MTRLRDASSEPSTATVVDPQQHSPAEQQRTSSTIDDTRDGETTHQEAEWPAPSHEKQLSAANADPIPYTIFSRKQIAFIVALASWSASFSGLSSNIYFPSIYVIASDLHVTPELVNLTVTLYLLFQGLSPSLWAPLSDTKGRRAVILITFTLYVGANVGLALTRDIAQLMVLRAVQSSGSASSVAIGAAIVGDVADKAERAGYMGLFNAASLLATAVGPIIGGAMGETVGWRSIFWLLVAYAGVYLIVAAIFMPETMRKSVGNGSIVPKGVARCPTLALWLAKEDRVCLDDEERKQKTDAAHFHLSHVIQPILLLRHAKVFCSVVYLSLHYAVWQMSLTACSTFFAQRYALNQLQVGLTFLANGAGCIAGTLIAGRLLDRGYVAAVDKHRRRGQQSEQQQRSFRQAHARLYTVWHYSAVECAAVLVLGWTVHFDVHIAVPIVASFFIAAAVLAVQVAVSTFLVDSFPAQSASANATLNLGRCLLAAGGTAAILPMSNGMNVGWAFTLLCFLLLLSNGLIAWQLHVEHQSVTRKAQTEHV